MFPFLITGQSVLVVFGGEFIRLYLSRQVKVYLERFYHFIKTLFSTHGFRGLVLSGPFGGPVDSDSGPYELTSVGISYVMMLPKTLKPENQSPPIVSYEKITLYSFLT